jgi:sulfite reductase alpha subunit-like flavoprotein
MSRGDMKELGELVDTGQAALVIVGESRIGEQLDKALTRALKTVEKQTEADSKEFQRELKQAERESAAG